MVQVTGMDCERLVGWSGTFMKEGIAAFLLVLYNGEKLAEGTSRMLSKIAPTFQ